MSDKGRRYKNAARRDAELQLNGKALERRRRLRTLLLLFAITLAAALLYYGACRLYPYAFLFFYGAAILLGFAYVLANYGFARAGMTLDSFVPTIPLDERRKYIEERDRRRASTKWMLMLLIPLLLVIGMDVLYLFWGEYFMNFLRSLT